MAGLIGEGVGKVVKDTGLAKVVSGAQTGAGNGVGILGNTGLIHCDGGVGSAKVLVAGGSAIWSGKGLSIGKLGLGLGLGSLGPVLAFAAGAATFYGISEFRKSRERKRRGRAARDKSFFGGIFNGKSATRPRMKKRVFSFMGFNVWH